MAFNNNTKSKKKTSSAVDHLTPEELAERNRIISKRILDKEHKEKFAPKRSYKTREHLEKEHREVN